MSSRDFFLPDENPVDTPELWTPDGLVHVGSDDLGMTGEGETALSSKFEMRTTIGGRKYKTAFAVVHVKSDSWENIEDAAAAQAERELSRMIIKNQRLMGKMRPDELDPDTKKELSATLRDFRAAARKRAETTTGRVYHTGLGGVVD
jgi:hypothetical protein